MPDQASSAPEGSHRTTVVFTPRGNAALQRIRGLKGENTTEAVNRAVQLYALLEEIWAEGGAVALEPKDGKPTYLRMY